MREVKYLAWDEISEKICKVTDMNLWSDTKEQHSFELFDGEEVLERDFEDITLMQYTGTKDKNGKEIYEGYIVKASSQGVWGTFEVKWRQEGLPSWILYPAFQEGEFWKLHGTKQKDGSYKDNSVEIIGNIFKNPDLITA